jgi:hypothetical protein
MPRGLISFVLVLLCVAGWAFSARAESAPKTVVMLADPSVLPLARRLRQEIESLGLAVKWIAPEGVRLPSLEDEALAAGAVASIRIAPMGSADVDMTIFDGVTGKTVSWKLVAATAADPAAAELIATRTVELLRASLLEMAARRSAAAETPVQPEAQPLVIAEHDSAKTRDRAQSLAILVGPSLLYSTDWRPGAHLLTALTWMPVYRAGLSASVLVPLTPARWSGQEGAVDLFASFYRLGAVLELAGARSPLSVRIGAGIALGRLHLTGTGNPSYLGVSDDRFVASPSVGATLRWFLVPNLDLFADLQGSAAFPKTVVRAAGREVADWGRPALAAAMGLELAWPQVSR